MNTTLEGVRQIIVRRFIDLQYEKMRESAKRMGPHYEKADIDRFIEFQVKEAFDRTGADYERPQKGDLIKVVEILLRKAAQSARNPRTSPHTAPRRWPSLNRLPD